MARRTCPACQRRYAGLVDPDCPICEGVGVVALHPVALYRSDPVVVARAIELYLESTSREAARVLPPGELRRDAVAVGAARLRAARVIGEPLGVADNSDRTPEPEGAAERRIVDWEAARLAVENGATMRPSDAANLDADRVSYGPDDRPHASGLLPSVSAGGHPSALAKAADPRDALGPDTRALVYAEHATDRSARVVASAVDQAAAARFRQVTA